MTAWADLGERARRDGASPLVTYVDLASGSRAELSAASLANAVAKTAGLLRDELDIEPGARIGIDLPLHWQWAVWLGAASAVGAIVVPGELTTGPDLVVTSSGAPPADGADVVVVSLHPLGLPEGDVPRGCVDHAMAARAHPDVFAPAEPPSEGRPMLELDGRILTAEDAAREASGILDARGIPPGGRLLLRDDRDMALAPLALLLALSGSAVLVRHAGSGDLARVAREERVSGE